MQTELLQQGVQLMVAGMAVVFSLLGVLVLALKVMSGLAGMFAPSQAVAESAGSGAAGDVDDPALIAAVTAAVRANREEAQK